MPSTRSEASLVRALGVWALAANIVNVTVGGGIFRLPAAAASSLGAAAPVAYIICAVAMGLIVLCFAEAGSRVSMTGGVYAYVEVAFGPFVGFLCGVMLWAGVTAAVAAVSSFFADSLGALVPALAAGLPRTVTIVVVLGAFGALNIAGVRGASRFNVVMTTAKLLPLLLLVVVGAFAMRAPNLAVTRAPAPAALARSCTVLIFAFLGVESALMPSGEVRDPARTVPRAIFLAIGGVAVLYLAVQVVSQGVLGGALAGQKTPLAEAAAAAMGPAGRTLILAGTILSMFGYLSGMILAVPRALFAFGRDGFLPARFAAVHERFHTPWVAIAAQTLIVILLATSGTFESLAILANSSVLLAYAACCAATLALRRRDVRMDAEPFAVPFGAAVPIAALLVIAWLLTSLTRPEWRALVVVLVAAAAVYAASAPHRRALAAEPATPAA